MTAIFVGLVFIVLGSWGIIRYFGDLLIFLRGMLPLSLFLGGVMALIAGISSLQARRGHGPKKD